MINENILGTSPAKLALHVPMSLPTTGFATSSWPCFQEWKDRKSVDNAQVQPTPPNSPSSHPHTHITTTHQLTDQHALFDVHGKKHLNFFKRVFFFSKKNFGAKPVQVFLFFTGKHGKAKLFVRNFPAENCKSRLAWPVCLKRFRCFFPVNVQSACWCVPQHHNTPRHTTPHTSF